jgi:hypothetical protein
MNALVKNSLNLGFWPLIVGLLLYYFTLYHPKPKLYVSITAYPNSFFSRDDIPPKKLFSAMRDYLADKSADKSPADKFAFIDTKYALEQFLANEGRYEALRKVAGFDCTYRMTLTNGGDEKISGIVVTASDGFEMISAPDSQSVERFGPFSRKKGLGELLPRERKVFSLLSRYTCRDRNFSFNPDYGIKVVSDSGVATIDYFPEITGISRWAADYVIPALLGLFLLVSLALSVLGAIVDYRKRFPKTTTQSSPPEKNLRTKPNRKKRGQ